jgi:hypothetical protein
VEVADGLMQVGRNAGWWWALRGAVVLTERPRYVKLDESGRRLHSAEGPAIVYPDGFGVWAWHGLRVERALIEDPVTVEQIQTQPNTELRRMLTERYGLDRYVKDADAELVSEDDWGKLWRVEMPGDEPLVMVEMVNSTPEPDGSFHTYLERVPPDTRTPLEGLAWQADLPVDVYASMTVQT